MDMCTPAASPVSMLCVACLTICGIHAVLSVRSGTTCVHVQMILKCADIGHLAASPRTHRRWAFQLEEEFFRQVLPNHTFVLTLLSAGSASWMMLAVTTQTGMLWTAHVFAAALWAVFATSSYIMVIAHTFWLQVILLSVCLQLSLDADNCAGNNM